ncbi:unnamed protein product [Prorocentrum cordatum]|uniref:Uncharacterized protein n=1 Tax=Prorocentrum cordatum TaxID=2364126 RepID=A0ABN9VCA6_9DINO|nr:unnamed protein product [Polarella glacialis]
MQAGSAARGRAVHPIRLLWPLLPVAASAAVGAVQANNAEDGDTAQPRGSPPRDSGAHAGVAPGRGGLPGRLAGGGAGRPGPASRGPPETAAAPRRTTAEAESERAILRTIETFYGQTQEVRASSRKPSPAPSRSGTPTRSKEPALPQTESTVGPPLSTGWLRQPDPLAQTAAFGFGSPMAPTSPLSPPRRQNTSPPPSSSSLWPPTSSSGVPSQQRPGTPPRSRSAAPPLECPLEAHARLQQQCGQNCGQPHGESYDHPYVHGDYYDQGAVPRSPRSSGRYDLTLGAGDRSPRGLPRRATSPWRVCM